MLAWADVLGVWAHQGVLHHLHMSQLCLRILFCLVLCSLVNFSFIHLFNNAAQVCHLPASKPWGQSCEGKETLSPWGADVLLGNSE